MKGISCTTTVTSFMNGHEFEVVCDFISKCVFSLACRGRAVQHWWLSHI